MIKPLQMNHSKIELMVRYSVTCFLTKLDYYLAYLYFLFLFCFSFIFSTSFTFSPFSPFSPFFPTYLSPLTFLGTQIPVSLFPANIAPYTYLVILFLPVEVFLFVAVVSPIFRSISLFL